MDDAVSRRQQSQEVAGRIRALPGVIHIQSTRTGNTVIVDRAIYGRGIITVPHAETIVATMEALEQAVRSAYETTR